MRENLGEGGSENREGTLEDKFKEKYNALYEELKNKEITQANYGDSETAKAVIGKIKATRMNMIPILEGIRKGEYRLDASSNVSKEYKGFAEAVGVEAMINNIPELAVITDAGTKNRVLELLMQEARDAQQACDDGIRGLEDEVGVRRSRS